MRMELKFNSIHIYTLLLLLAFRFTDFSFIFIFYHNYGDPKQIVNCKAVKRFVHLNSKLDSSGNTVTEN